MVSASWDIQAVSRHVQGRHWLFYNHAVVPSAARFTAGCTSATLEVTLPTGVFGAIGGLATRLAAARLTLLLRGLQCDALCAARLQWWWVRERVVGGWGVVRRIVHNDSQCLWPIGHGDAHAAIRYGLFVHSVHSILRRTWILGPGNINAAATSQ